MKQKLLCMLALMLTFVCTHHVCAEDLVAPVEPEWRATPTTLVSGKVYYLYCPATERYLTEYSTTYCGASKDFSVAQAVVLTQSSNGWTMQRAEKGTYLWGSSQYAYNDKNTLDSYCYWNIVPATSADKYNILRSETNPNYVAERYFAYTTSSSYSSSSNYYVYADRTYSANCDWQLIDAEVRERYLATKRLYDALIVAQLRGMYTSKYDRIYSESYKYPVRELFATAINLEKANANGESGMISEDNEFPLIIETLAGSWGTNKSYGYGESGRYSTVAKGVTNIISATFKVEHAAVVRYGTYTESGVVHVNVYVDGVLVRTIDHTGESAFDGRYVEEVTAGEHTIEWRYENTSEENSYKAFLGNLCVMDMTLINVSLLEPGSLGTEVLYNVDGLKDVKNLKVKGKMNSDDWDKIAMMTKLITADLSEAEFTSVPSSKFKSFVHRVILPEGVVTIEEYAFSSTYVEYLNIPNTVERIGQYAFTKTEIRELTLPNSVKSMGRNAFDLCHRLHEVALPGSLATVPDYAFYDCRALTHCILTEGIQNIGNHAFEQCYSLRQSFPESLKTIGNYAYQYCDKLSFESDSVLTLPQNITTIGVYAFGNSNGFNKAILEGGSSIEHNAFNSCKNLKDVIIKKAKTIGMRAFYNCSCLESIELPVDYYHFTNQEIFSYCPNVNKVILRSPTVVTLYFNGSYNYGLGCDLSKVDLFIPDYLINQYKLDSYWYNYKTISGFSTADIQDWRINLPLVLDAHSRLLGNPNISINGDSENKPSLKINGDTPMSINNLYFKGSYSGTYYNYPGQILSNCDNITVTGNVRTTLWSKAKYWYFYSLPFDIKISEITHSDDGVQKAVRYYDGANRAEKGASGSWKNYEADAVIPAGTGFIMQTNVDTWNYFKAIDNDSKQLCVSNRELVKTLDVNDSENKSNRGWNLVGNPWQCYYNNHALNFTGPITVWSVGNRTYTAYSITDDDYAIAPNEAFFVQCPNDEYNTIGFPTNGRQLTSVIESQNAARHELGITSNRQIVNITISNGEMEDQTRVVLNEKASIEYETVCDASKFMSMDNSVPQLYTLDNQGNSYAINERPAEDGIVRVGFYAGATGDYTICVKRCDAEQIFLIDYLTGKTHEITNDSYTFSAKAGTDNDRFCLSFVSNDATAIENIEQLNNGHIEVFGMDGKYLGSDASKLKTGVYVIRQGKKINKVMVR